MEEKESQVMEVAACDRATARRLLQRNGDDAQAAIMAFYSGDADVAPPSEGQGVVTPYQQVPSQPSHTDWTPPPSDTAIGPQQPGSAYEQNWGSYDVNAAKEGERTSKKRNTPVDLTNDEEDDDLRKAMQASLESESSRQKRQQEYGYTPRMGTRVVSGSEDHLSGLHSAGQSGAGGKGSGAGGDGSRSTGEEGSEAADRDDMTALAEETTSHHQKSARRGVYGSRRGRTGSSCMSRHPIQHDSTMDDGDYATGQDERLPTERAGHHGSRVGYNLRDRKTVKRPATFPFDNDMPTRSETSTSAKPRQRSCKTGKESKWRQTASAANDDDEALTRAIEASMQQNSTAVAPHSPEEQTEFVMESMGALRMRLPGEPVTIVPPNRFVRLFALALQVMYAATPLREAFMMLKLSDLRLEEGSTMEQYWQGKAPCGVNNLTEGHWQKSGITATEEDRDAIEVTMRLLTLFVFLTLTKRPLCIPDDVINHPAKGNYAYVLNSSRKPASDIVSCHVQATWEYVVQTIECLNKQNSGALDDCRDAVRSACMSLTSSAVAPQSEEPRQMRRPKDSYEVIVHHLIHNNVNTSVHKALYAHLAEDKSLYTSTSATLFFSVVRLGASNLPFGFGMEAEAVEEVAPFEVESQLFLDQFMFDKRNGVRLGLDSDRVKQREVRIAELERYRKSITVHQGTDSRALLRSSLVYFEQLCNTDGADQIRMDSIQEAKPRLKRMLDALEGDIASVDAQLVEERRAVDEERRMTMGGFLEGLCNSQLQTIRYDLQAVMVNNDQTAWAYIRHESSSRDQSASTSSVWWKVCDGERVQVAEADVLNDPNVVHFLVYTRHEPGRGEEWGGSGKAEGASVASGQAGEESEGSKPKKSLRLDSGLDWWADTPLVEGIEIDNMMFGKQLAQKMRDAQGWEYSGEGEAEAMAEDGRGGE